MIEYDFFVFFCLMEFMDIQFFSRTSHCREINELTYIFGKETGQYEIGTENTEVVYKKL